MKKVFIDRGNERGAKCRLLSFYEVGTVLCCNQRTVKADKRQKNRVTKYSMFGSNH